jgi:hypothetical protein
MHSDLEILGILSSVKFPLLSLATDLNTGLVGVSTGEER